MNEFDLERFLKMHQIYYDTALAEIRQGRKHSHWIWFIFPQIKGLGKSQQSQFYAIASLAEAEAFLADETLGAHLIEITGELLKLDKDDPADVMGSGIDAVKLRSSMTLFSSVSGAPSVFNDVLQKYYGGRADGRTLAMLGIPKR